MWVLENEGQAFEGKRLWLRPGKRYLFGRTVAEPGMLAIKGDAKAVSRKHCTITVDAVQAGDAENMTARSRVTVEDLGSKGGTTVNGEKIKAGRYVLQQDLNTLKMGAFQQLFRISWHPVVFSYSFTSKELRADPFFKLRQCLEHIDIKYLSEYDVRSTTHAVSKKRNTSKGLQALINGKYIVDDGFVNAVMEAATPADPVDGIDASPLESDFDANWPDASRFLPPAGDEPVSRPDEAFAPNERRADIFDGYTFIFYDAKQYDSLMAPITNGKGKALLKEVVPRETQIDDFIRYVKGVAGEKGLGEFEDGSEGKGVVVVQFMPRAAEPQDLQWYADFYTNISLRLDHRLINQKEFLDAILCNDASGLRRPLQEASQSDPRAGNPPQAMEVDGPGGAPAEPAQPSASSGQPVPRGQPTSNEQPAPSEQPPAPRRRGRRGIKKEFAGFGVTLDDVDDTSLPPAPPPAETPVADAPAGSQEEGLFVSQDVASPEPEPAANTRSTRQKRGRAEDLIDGFAPTAAEAKRRRIEAGEELGPRQAAAPAAEPEARSPTKKTPQVKTEDVDVIGIARQNREEAEARARREREELAEAAADLDFGEIRAMQTEEVLELRQPAGTRAGGEDAVDPRWDPAWNGRKNFKRFQKRGATQGARPPQRTTVPIEPVQNNTYGLGEDYWIESQDSENRRRKRGPPASASSGNPSQGRRGPSQGLSEREGRGNSAATRSRQQPSPPQPNRRIAGLAPVDSSDEEDDGASAAASGVAALRVDDRGAGASRDEYEDEDVIPATVRTRSSRGETSQSQGGRSLRSAGASQAVTQPSSTGRPQRSSAATGGSKRGAPQQREQPPPKRPRVAPVAASDDDDSDDGHLFKFGRR